MTRRLEDEVEALRAEPITEPMGYLYLDATFIDARGPRTVEHAERPRSMSSRSSRLRELVPDRILTTHPEVFTGEHDAQPGPGEKPVWPAPD